MLEKAREEVAKTSADAALDYSNVMSLRYVRAILDEGLRLHPSVPFEVKETVAEDTLPDGTKVYAGTMMSFLPYAQGRCEGIWGKDAEIFRPERWLERETAPSSYEFTAFNAGPRECLGKRLAQMEMTFFLAMFIRDFDFSLAVDPSEVRCDNQLTLGCSSGLPMIITARS